VGRFQFGQIVLAYISDGHGRTKERPALIISSDEENDRGDDLQLIAITTKIESPRPFYQVVVHDSFNPDARTGLGAPCVAKCNWVRDVK
jgi:mRNA-degrading endonuclease toxin of MazEF toxin-antitoxin module